MPRAVYVLAPFAFMVLTAFAPAEGAFDGDLWPGEWSLDLRPAVREEWLLAAPAFPLCREDCRGLCPQCGANLNEDPEHAHEAAPDPRWAKLSELKFD